MGVSCILVSGCGPHLQSSPKRLSVVERSGGGAWALNLGPACLITASGDLAHNRGGNDPSIMPSTQAGEEIRLPEARYEGDMSLETTLKMRRSIREYADEGISTADVAQLLWAAQGISDPAQGGRTAPSAGALYPLELYLVAARVTGLGPAVYRYNPRRHSLVRVLGGDKRSEIARAALRQECLEMAPAVLVITAVRSRTAVKYGERAERFVHIEVGHAVENVYLQAVSLGLGTVMVGAFEDDEIKKVLRLPEGEEPMALMPVGKPAR